MAFQKYPHPYQLLQMVTMTPSEQRLGPFDKAVSPCPALGNKRGFTLIEIIAVLLLMGIIVAVTVGKSGDSTAQSDVAGAVETVKNHLRYAQATAMNSDVPWWRINFSASTYTLCKSPCSSNNDNFTLPGDLPQGMTFTPNPVTVTFDNRWGIPVDNANAPVTSDITVTVKKGSVSKTITVTKKTGFIP